jgi:hypothetical protein
LKKRARKGEASDGPCGLGRKFKSEMYESSGNEMKQNVSVPKPSHYTLQY